MVWVAKQEDTKELSRIKESTKHTRKEMLQFRQALAQETCVQDVSDMLTSLVDDSARPEQLEGNRRALRALLKERKAAMRGEEGGEVEKYKFRACNAAERDTGDFDAFGHTVMLRNIPNQYSRHMLCQQLTKQGFESRYDFLYLPIDRTSDRNMGYAFINFRSAAWKQEFVDLFDGTAASKCLPGFDSAKVCRVRRAQVQGQEANMAKLAQPGFMEALRARDEWQPLFFDEKGIRIPVEGGDQTTPESLAKMLRPAEGSGKNRKTAWSMWRPSDAVKAPEFVPGAVAVLSPLPASAAAAREFVPSATSDIDDDANFVLPPAEMAAEEALEEAKVKAKEAARARTKAPDSKVQSKVRSQIEYYFSEGNVGSDTYLLSCMDCKGWVSLAVLVKFPRVQALVGSVGAVACCSLALADSSSVEVSEDGLKVRIRNVEARGVHLQNKTSAVDASSPVGSPLFGPGCRESVGSNSTCSSPKLGLMPSPNLKAVALAARCHKLELSVGKLLLPRTAHTRRSAKRAPQTCKSVRARALRPMKR